MKEGKKKEKDKKITRTRQRKKIHDGKMVQNKVEGAEEVEVVKWRRNEKKK